jgi:hypothetical protein
VCRSRPFGHTPGRSLKTYPRSGCLTGLPKAVADVAELLSLCDAPLTREEVRSFVAAAEGSRWGPCSTAPYATSVDQGLLQVFANDRISSTMQGAR